jgi:hypothetical protein
MQDGRAEGQGAVRKAVDENGGMARAALAMPGELWYGTPALRTGRVAAKLLRA